MEVLLLLVDRPGELVLRSELSRVWQLDPASDTERSINTAIRKIRQALGDEADHPRFIETVAGKGYRFVADVAKPAESRLDANLSERTDDKTDPAAAGEPAPGTSGINTTPPPIRQLSNRYARAISAVILTMGLAGALLWIRASPTQGTVRITPFTALPGSELMPAFSPDGRRVAFSWIQEGGGQHIHLKAIAGGSEAQLTYTGEMDSYPAWSPDARLIAFLRQGPLRDLALCVISPAGRGERQVRPLKTRSLSRISWSPDGRSVAVVDCERPEDPPGIFLVSVDSGEEYRLTTPPSTSQGDWQPAFSPDGRNLAFLRNAGSFQAGLPYLLAVDSAGRPAAKPEPVHSDRLDLMGIEWSSDGHSLICAAGGGLVRVPIRGGATELLPFQDATEPSIARDGDRMVYAHAVQESAVFRVPGPVKSGAVTKLVASSRYSGAPKYSPDGTRIVFMSDRTGTDELWTSDSGGQNLIQLTSFRRGTLGSPRWSPNSRWIAFDSTIDGPGNIYVIPAEGGTPRRITSGDSSNVRPSWTHSGAWIYFGSNRSGAWEIWKVTPEASLPIQVTHTGGREAVEDAEGRYLYYVKDAPTPGIWRLPVAGGTPELVCDYGVQGRWDIGRRGLYYLNAQSQLELLELPGGRRIQVPTFGLPLGKIPGGLLGIAPDERWILITVGATFQSDLSLVENFR